MKIVYFIDHLRHDGTQQVLKQLVEGLAARGHKQVVICLNDDYDEALVNCMKAAGAEISAVGKLGFAFGYGFLSIWKRLRRERPDVAVTLLFVSDLVGRPIARISGVPHIVSSLRARNTHYPRWKRWLVRTTMQWVHNVVINSTSVREFAILEEGARPESIHYIPNGVDVRDYCHPVNRAELCAHLGLVPEVYLIGSVGRLTYQKGFDILLKAIALIPRPDVHLLLVGRGELGDMLRTSACSMKIASRVHFAGYRHDVPQLLGAFDLYVHPARFEGMPNIILEAMAAHCPIVATAVDGVRDLMEDGKHGWLTRPEDPGELAKAIQSAIEHPTEAHRRADAAFQRVSTEFSIDKMIGAWEMVLSQKT